jgi:hypothetical protein
MRCKLCGTSNSLLLSSPDFRKNALEISAKDELDIVVGVISADQALCEIVNLSFVVNPVQIVFAGQMTARVAPLQVDIAAEADVLYS